MQGAIIMTLNEYQDAAMATAIFKRSSYPFLALAEESGEVMGKLAKFVRKTDVPMDSAVTHARSGIGEAGMHLRNDLAKELGDVLWQVQACAHELNITLESLAQMNLDKVHGREQRGTLEGSGDDR